MLLIKMARSSEYDIDFEELERLFIDDTTDEQFSFDETEAISEPPLSVRIVFCREMSVFRRLSYF